MSAGPTLHICNCLIPDPEVLFEGLLEDVHWDESMKARKTASFGVPYNYSQMNYITVPFLPLMEEVAERLNEVLAVQFNNCLLNYYETGNHTMGFHSDETDGLQPETGVAIVSLGSSREITFRSKLDHTNCHGFQLEPGSLLYMDASIQEEWMHAIRRQPGAGPRISMTWRSFRMPA